MKHDTRCRHAVHQRAARAALLHQPLEALVVGALRRSEYDRYVVVLDAQLGQQLLLAGQRPARIVGVQVDHQAATLGRQRAELRLGRLAGSHQPGIDAAQVENLIGHRGGPDRHCCAHH